MRRMNLAKDIVNCKNQMYKVRSDMKTRVDTVKTRKEYWKVERNHKQFEK